MVKKALIILPGVLAVLAVSAFAHGYFEDFPEESESFPVEHLEHFRIMHDWPDATVEDMVQFHNEMHGSDFPFGKMVAGHGGMHGEGGGCPMHQNWDGSQL